MALILFCVFCCLLTVSSKEGGGGGGGETGSVNLKAKSTHQHSKKEAPSVSAKTMRTKIGSECSMSKGRFNDTTSTMCKCDATARSVKSALSKAAFAFAGKSVGNDGGSIKSNNARGAFGGANPVLSFLVEKAIGGALGICQLDTWTDNGLNSRGSVHMVVNNGVVLQDDTLNCRPSGVHPRLLALTFGLTSNFTNVDKKLECLLSQIEEAHPDCAGNKDACMRHLKNHPRCVAAKMNLKRLLGSKNQCFLVEHRVVCPFEVADALVAKAEDPIFHGFRIRVHEETGETHLCFELKERGKEFVAVANDGKTAADASDLGTPQKKSMFDEHFTAERMNPIPENITIQSPAPSGSASRHDDSSTIATKETCRYKAYKTTGLDTEDEEESWDDELGEETESEAEEEAVAMEVESDDEEIERLRSEVERWKSIATGVFQTTSRDSGESGGKASAGSTKKKRANDGGSVAGSKASRHSSATRGTRNREERRKTRNDEDESKKEK